MEKRKSNIELLRIFCILAIIISHFTTHNNLNFSNMNIKILNNILIPGSQIAVNCFIIMSGYFLINSEFKIKKFIKLVFEVVFYSTLIFTIFCIVNNNFLTKDNIILNLTPISHKIYWFFTNYIILYLLFPFINIMLKKLEIKQYKVLLLILLVLFSVIPTIITSSALFSELSWFVTLYCIGAYIRLYKNKYFENIKINVISFIIGFILVIISIILFTKYNINPVQRFGELNKVPIVIISVNLFLIFLNMNIKSNSFINTLSKYTFGVYVIHEHYMMRDFLWRKIFCAYEISSSLKLFLYGIVVTIIIYLACLIIDIIRVKLIEEPLFKIIDKIKYKKTIKKSNLDLSKKYMS